MREFSCMNGDCIDIRKRCDKLYDCEDKSDESLCNLLEFDKNAYFQLHPPFQDEKLSITLSVDLLSIFNIDEINMKFQCKLRLSMKWRDSRLTFVNLGEEGNILGLDEIESIWIPELEFDNSEDYSIENSLNTQSGQNQVVSIIKESNGSYPDTNFVNYGLRYPGNENSLMLKALHIKEFECQFEFQTYPFDSQNCFIQLSVPERHKEHLKLSAGSVYYSQEMSMAQYVLKNVTLVVIDTGIKCGFQLKRSISTYHVYSTFLPTFLILIMSLMSLFVKENHFEATIMVSLTCMLVLYTLFQSIMAGMPVTGHINMMAIWLTFNLIMPFIVFITIVCWELMRKEEIHQKKNEQESKRRSCKDKCKITMQVILPLISFTFVLYYTGFAIFFHIS